MAGQNGVQHRGGGSQQQGGQEGAQQQGRQNGDPPDPSPQAILPEPAAVGIPPSTCDIHFFSCFSCYHLCLFSTDVTSLTVTASLYLAILDLTLGSSGSDRDSRIPS